MKYLERNYMKDLDVKIMFHAQSAGKMECHIVMDITAGRT